MAHHGSEETERAFTAKFKIVGLRVDSPQTEAAVREIVRIAGEVPGERGTPLLPPGTTVDRVTWVGRLIAADITVPASKADFRLTPIDLESLSRAFNKPFESDSSYAGIQLRIRRGDADEYGTLAKFLDQPPYAAEEVDPLHSLEEVLPIDRVIDAADVIAPRGPTAQAARQPSGALTGVTVFISAGHGWTAGSSSDWFLQRPVLLGMCEDYGNIDQLNYFAAFLFNAGATVVPMRPVGWQPIEIVLDQDDPGVTYIGTWSAGSSAKYYENGATLSGDVYRTTSAASVETHVARYTPTITVSDFYPVYCFTIASSNRTKQTYRVKHSGGVSAVTIDHRNVGNGWIWLGDYYLVAGDENWVEINNQSTDSGAIVADAIRWGGGTGDIVRPGPGVISGYPRDEECQRMWAESLFGNNAVGFDSTIWDIVGSADDSDNVGTGARVGREMNVIPAGGIQSERWKRCHVEFHTNAFDTGTRGQLCLITNTGSTTNQTTFANVLSDEVDTDMTVMQSEFEHTWVDRSSPTLTGAYGAISTTNNSDEFDATLVELAFHDNATDAELLRDPRVRRAMARACMHGVIRFLNGLPGSQVPTAFPPDTPRNVRVEDLGGGDVRVSWLTPLADGARGDPATGYVVYRSSNGLGFGDPIILGNVLTTTITGVATGQTIYLRVAATNTGGESMPSEVLAVRRPADGVATTLIVNGFDRLRRQNNATQTFTQPANYVGRTIERQTWRASNSFDYVVEHAEALAASGEGFASCSNEAVSSDNIALGSYAIVDWIAGNDSVEDETLSTTEITRLQNFMNAGGDLFISGSELGFDLIAQLGGSGFANNNLRFNYVSDDAGTYNVAPTTVGIFDGMSAFDFDPASGAPYDAFSPDVVSARTGGRACMQFVGGAGGTAGVEYESGVFNAVTFSFPFECITSAAAQQEIMARVLNFLRTATGPSQFDNDQDGDVDFSDFQVFVFCMRGQGLTYPTGNFCRRFDTDGDADVDLRDFIKLQEEFTGPGGP